MKSYMKSKVNAEIFVTLSEEEARALRAISLYGVGKFVDCFFKHLGRCYLEDHVEGLRSLFESTRCIEIELIKIDKAREEMKEKK